MAKVTSAEEKRIQLEVSGYRGKLLMLMVVAVNEVYLVYFPTG